MQVSISGNFAHVTGNILVDILTRLQCQIWCSVSIIPTPNWEKR